MGLCAVGLGLVICIVGTVTENYLFLIAGILVFAGNAVPALRYAAAEICKQNAIAKGTSVTYVISAGILSAALGPSISSICFAVVKDQQFLAAFSVMVVCIAGVVLNRIEFPPLVAPEVEEDQVARQSGCEPVARVSARSLASSRSSAAIRYGHVPGLRQHRGHGHLHQQHGHRHELRVRYPLSHVAVVYLVHFVGMTAPGLFSGAMILRCGVYTSCIVGCLFKVCAIAIFFTERNFAGFLVGAVFLGVAGTSPTAALPAGAGQHAQV